MFTFSRLFARFFTGILLLTMPFGFSNCGSSSDSVEPASLAGNYTIVSDKISPALDFFGFKIDDLVAFIKELSGSDCYTKLIFTLKEDGTQAATLPKGCEDFFQDTQGIDVGVATPNGTWKLDGDKLTLTDKDKKSETFTVKRSLTGFSMTRQQEEKDQNNKTVLYTLTTTFKRVP